VPGEKVEIKGVVFFPPKNGPALLLLAKEKEKIMKRFSPFPSFKAQEEAKNEKSLSSPPPP